MSDTEFAALLCSRLCHDLVSPIGALSNGIEILGEENDAEMQAQVMDLLQKSARQTTNKLQFFRLAFGAAGGFSQQLDMREAHKAMAAYFENSRVELIWESHLQHASKQVVKLLLNTAMMMGESMIRGGKLTVDLHDEGNQRILFVKAEAGRFLMAEAVKQGLRGELSADDLDPRTAPAHLAGQLVGELGGCLTLKDTHENVTILECSIPVEQAG